MSDDPKDKVEKLCSELNIPEPIAFLTQLMGGVDSRRVSQPYTRVIELLEEYGDESPDAWDWLELAEMITTEYRQAIVDIKASQDAAKQLLEYMHPKRKSIDKTVSTKAPPIKKLSKAEIKALAESFNLDY